MYNKNLTVTIKEGIHIPLEICHTCPFFNSCMMSDTKAIQDKNKRMEKLCLHKDLVSEVISDHYKIPNLPIYFYDNPNTMYEKLGFFWSQLNYDENCNCLMHSMYSDPLIIVNARKGVLMNQIHENLIIDLFEKIKDLETLDLDKKLNINGSE
jgi:hypothetical protein